MPTIHDTIGPYEVIRPIAQGGMAEVFEVRDPDSGERRALKLLMELRTSVKRFNREFEAMTRLNHPGIVRVYRYGYHERHPWMSMELLRGVPLQVRVKAAGNPGTDSRTEEVVRIAYYVANALQYIHDRGIVHRDLKSANVQVLRDGRVKLLDFGTAHLVDPLERLTQEGDFVGTFSYAAPEQILGTHVDHRADLYALGVLLYRLLTGRRPFKASDPHKVAHMHLHVTPKPIRSIVPELSEDLDALVTRLLSKKREDRHDNADEVANELERIAGGSITMRGHGLAVYDDPSVGRATEHRQVWAALQASQPGHLVAVVGDDPLGRARFLDQLRADAEPREVVCVRASPADAATTIAHTLSGLVMGDDEAAIQLRELLTAPEGAALASRVESAIRTAPGVLARLRVQGTETLVLVDEVDEQDPEALRTLSGLLKHAAELGTKLRMVATASQPTTSGLSVLRGGASGGTGVRLGPLDARHTALVVGNLLHRRPPPAEAARHIHAATGGHPTLIEEVVRDLVESGRIQVRDDDGNRVDWAGEGRARNENAETFPPAVRARLDERVGTLPLAWRRVLEVLDLVGGRASVHQISHAVGIKAADLPLILHQMIDDGWIRWKGTPKHAVLPTDPLVVRYVGATIQPHRRAAVQHLVADLVEREPPAPAQIPLLVAVGKIDAALRRAMLVSRDLLNRGEVDEALVLLDTVMPHVDRADVPNERRIAFHLLIAEAIQRVRPMDARTVRSLETAAQLAAGTPREASVRFGQAEHQRAIGHYANHRRYLLEAWDLVEHQTDAPLRPKVALELAQSHNYGAQLNQARSWFDTAHEAANALGDAVTSELARVGIAELHLAHGDPDAALEGLAPVLEATVEGSDPAVRWFAIAAWGHVLRRQGRFSEALALLMQAVTEARDGQSVQAWAAVVLSAAEIELDLYRLGRAQELVEELASALGPGERLHLRLEARLFQGRLELASGQPLAANFLLEEVVDQAELAGLAMIAELARAYLAQARWAVGAHDESKMLYQKALLGLMSTGHLCALSDAIVSRARAVGQDEDPTKAFRLVRRLLSRGQFQPLYIEHLLSETRWYRTCGEDALVRQSLREAQAAINRLAARQTDIEQAAMRVHPWAHEVTQVQQQQKALAEAEQSASQSAVHDVPEEAPADGDAESMIDDDALEALD